MDTLGGLPAHAVQALRRVLASRPAIESATLYGSRAKGNFRPGSDIDLTLTAPTMSLRDLFLLQDEIDELMLPWKMDLSLKHKIDNPDLLDHIERVGLVFWHKGMPLAQAA